MSRRASLLLALLEGVRVARFNGQDLDALVHEAHARRIAALLIGEGA